MQIAALTPADRPRQELCRACRPLKKITVLSAPERNSSARQDRRPGSQLVLQHHPREHLMTKVCRTDLHQQSTIGCPRVPVEITHAIRADMPLQRSRRNDLTARAHTEGRSSTLCHRVLISQRIVRGWQTPVTGILTISSAIDELLRMFDTLFPHSKRLGFP